MTLSKNTYQKKLLFIGSLSFAILIFSSCKKETRSDSENNLKKLANCEITIPIGCKIVDGKKMEIFSIVCPERTAINVFNFGKKPVTIKGNIERWESQMDTVFKTEQTSYNKELVTYCEISGIKNQSKKSIYAAIIPTEDGPYYLKNEDFTSNEKTRFTFKQIVKSIKYDKNK